MKNQTAVSTFKGHVVLNIEDPNSDHPFAIGLRKARLLLANLDAVKAFVASQDEKPKKQNATTEIQKAATKAGVDPGLLAAVIDQLRKGKTEKKSTTTPKAAPKPKVDVNVKNKAVIDAILKRNGALVIA